MNIAKAKDTIAAYLSGRRRVPLEELQLACEAVSADEAYVRQLRDELGLDIDLASACQVFLANVAEFADLSEAERAREMPELVEHLEHCKPCRLAYWDVMDTWKPVALAEFKEAAAISKALAEGIRLMVDARGRLFERGFGPPALSGEPLGKLMGDWTPEAATQEDETRESESSTWIIGYRNLSSAFRDQELDDQKTWLLKDEDEQCSIRIVVHGLASGRAALKCWLEAKPPSKLDATGAHIEVLDAQTDSLHLSGKLSAFQVDPIYLQEGLWLIRIIAYSDGDARTWEFPLDIRHAKPADEIR